MGWFPFVGNQVAGACWCSRQIVLCLQQWEGGSLAWKTITQRFFFFFSSAWPSALLGEEEAPVIRKWRFSLLSMITCPLHSFKQSPCGQILSVRPGGGHPPGEHPFPEELQVVLGNTIESTLVLLPGLTFMLLDQWCSCRRKTGSVCPEHQEWNWNCLEGPPTLSGTSEDELYSNSQLSCLLA